MRAVDATLACLKRAGVDAIFGLPGGPVIPLFDALHDDPDIRTFLVRHEQGAGHMAEGYAKVTGRAGVCTATSGPGATNLVTPIADAYMDSVPLVAITGQVGSTRVGTDAFQEADIVGITLPIVKHSYLIKDADDLPRAMAEALHIAQTGRPGPVLVDVCVDQWAREVEDLDDPLPPDARLPAARRRRPPAPARGRRPRAGGRRAAGDLRRRRDHHRRGLGRAAPGCPRCTGIPVNTTLMGLGGFPGTHPLFIGMPGMHGIAAAHLRLPGVGRDPGRRRALRRAGAVDRHERVGARAPRSSTSTSTRPRSPRTAPPTSASPARPPRRWPRSPRPTRRCPSPTTPPKRAGWVDQIAAWKRQHPYQIDDDPGVIQPQHVVQSIYRITRGDAIIVHRRRPAPDVGRPALPVRPPAALAHLGRPRHDGLRPAGRPRRPGRDARRAGGR